MKNGYQQDSSYGQGAYLYHLPVLTKGLIFPGFDVQTEMLCKKKCCKKYKEKGKKRCKKCPEKN